VKARSSFRVVVFFLLLTAALTLAAGPAQAEMAPQINAKGQVVWYASSSGARQIYRWDPKHPDQPAIISTGLTTFNNYYPQINAKGQVVWYSLGGIYFWDPKHPEQPNSISSDNTFNYYPQINAKGQVVWQSEDNTSARISLRDPRNPGPPTIISQDLTDNYVPQINAKGQVVWYGGNAAPYQIFLWDPKNPEQTTIISKNTNYNFNPQINAKGQVVWQGDAGIYLWDPRHQEPTIISGNLGGDNPQINAKGQVVWRYGNSGAHQICLWNPKKGPVFPVSGDNNDNFDAAINDKGYVVWETTGATPGVYLYKPKTGVQGIKISP
jgi:hypothetical protein